jgi:hypothetical protein
MKMMNVLSSVTNYAQGIFDGVSSCWGIFGALVIWF